MTMLEKIARAIAQAKDPQWFGTEEARIATCLPLARAAVEAMREPTEAMKIARLKASTGYEWHYMIDAILQEDESRGRETARSC